MARVLRFDAGSTRGVEKTPEGFARVVAAVARPGVLPYRDTAGKEWREWVPPEELFAEDSLATLRGRPVTDHHPTAMVTSDTWKDVTKGTVGEDARADGGYALATLTVLDADAVRLIESGGRRDVSCGYTCEVDWTPGVTPDGEHYDAIQRRRRYNHVALLPPGEGRAGTDVALRMDAAAQVVPPAAAGAPITTRRDAAAEVNAMKFRFRGKEYRCDSAEEMTAAQTAVDETAKKADDSGAELAAVRKALQDALGKIAVLEATQAATAAAAPAPDAAAMDVAALDARIAVREALRADARKVLGADAKLDGVPDRKIHETVIAKVLPDTRLDAMSAETIAGMFRGIVGTHRNDALGATREVAEGAGSAAGSTERKDASDESPEAKRRAIQAKYERSATQPISAYGKGA